MKTLKERAEDLAHRFERGGVGETARLPTRNERDAALLLRELLAALGELTLERDEARAQESSLVDKAMIAEIATLAPAPQADLREAIERAIRDNVHFNHVSGSREVDYDGAVVAVLAALSAAEGLKAELEEAQKAMELMTDHLTHVLPLAKGYAADHPVGANNTIVTLAYEALASAKAAAS